MIRRSTVILALAALVACGKADKPADKPTTTVATTPAVKPEEKPQAPGPVVHPTSSAEWESVDYTANSIAVADLKPLPLDEVQHIRAIIFGKHGRIFEDSTLQGWLAARPWYHADKAFTNKRLSSNEKANLDVVREAEAEKHPQIESGDMRFYQNRVITSAMLGTHTPQDWEVLKSEVLAEHGFVFGDEDWDGPDGKPIPTDIQRYFDQRYWYSKDTSFLAKSLSGVEQQNIDTIDVASMRQVGRGVTPGQMNLFQTTALTEQMLKNTPIGDLRLLRNEVYARRGRIFQTPWLASYFRASPWYKPRTDFSDSELTPTEKANIAMITAREQQMHDELSTRELSIGQVMSIRPEDAKLLRNEIYARHGRRFKDPALRSYFSGFAWYKPRDGFTENQLNPIERKNVQLIADREHGKFSEG